MLRDRASTTLNVIHVNPVDETWNIEDECEDQVDQKVSTQSLFKRNAKWWQKNGGDKGNQFHHE